MSGAGHAFSTQSPITTPDRSSVRLVSEQQPSHTRSLSNISTGYNGAQGILDDSINTEYTGYSLPSTPGKAYTPDRPAIGSRLLTSLQNAQPTAAAISRSTSVLHSRAKSLAAFVPKLGQNSPNASPSPEARPQSSQQGHSNKLFGDLFNGDSAPVRLGIPPSSPIKELEEMEFPTEYRTAFTERPRKRASMLNSTPQSQKTSWFGRKLASPMHQQPSPAANDELANMNLMTSLFPNGQPDELTPRVYNDLLVNATNLLQRLQSAYKDKVEYIATLQPEMDVQREEIEEADIRSRHLKLQLQDMGRRAQEQESAMQALASQLSQERFRNQEARERESRKASSRFASKPSPALSSNADETTDDDETTPRRFPYNKRLSGGSTDASDSGFESDLDRDNWAQDPLDPSHQRTAMGSPGPLTPTKQRGVGFAGNQHAPLTSSSLRNSVKRLGSDGSAWAVMERLRVENVALKAQVGDMQRELQGCIELIGHMRL